MAFVWQIYRLLVNLPIFSYGFSKFVLALFFSHVFEFLSQMSLLRITDQVCLGQKGLIWHPRFV